MTPTPQDVLARRAAVERLTDRAVSDFELALAQVVRQIERQLRGLVAGVAEGSRTAIIKAAKASRLRNELRNLLTDAGFDNLLDHATDAALDRLAQAALQSEVGKDVSAFVASLRPRIDALKALALSDLIGQGDLVASALWRATVNGVFSARPTDAILRDLIGLIDDTVPHIRTLYDTTVSIYGRQVEQLMTKGEPDELFVYLGPLDQVTREWCEERVGKVFSRAEIDEMDNGQLPTPMLTSGGYNCRHAFTLISKFSELADLAGTDKRMPEVERVIQGRAA